MRGEIWREMIAELGTDLTNYRHQIHNSAVLRLKINWLGHTLTSVISNWIKMLDPCHNWILNTDRCGINIVYIWSIYHPSYQNISTFILLVKAAFDITWLVFRSSFIWLIISSITDIDTNGDKNQSPHLYHSWLAQ